MQDLCENEQRFLELVGRVCARPGLYVAPAQFDAVVNFLHGYALGLIDSGRLQTYPFGNLLTLLEQRHGFSHPSWGWWRHYLHDKETEERAIRDLPEFLREGMRVPQSRIKEFDAARPSNNNPPESPQTRKYDAPISP
jgi:hypothetical protein